jgi:hypothetical protein
MASASQRGAGCSNGARFGGENMPLSARWPCGRGAASCRSVQELSRGLTSSLW